MNTDKILELFFFLLPAILTGTFAYGFFKNFLANEERKRRWMSGRQSMKLTLPIRLQAYERMALFLERVEPSKLLVRVPPISTDKNDYANYVIAHIEQEFEHNLTQQIYVSDECWSVITTAKNATIQALRKAALQTGIQHADQLREAVLNEYIGKTSPSYAGLAFIKQEVSELL